MSEISKCNRCGTPLPANSPEGLCPRCLVALNLATQTEISGETQTAKLPPSPPLPIDEIAKLFPQLEILECLGRGGMGAVYKARQPRLDRIVALKILSPEKQGNQKFAERFEREARALAKLHHPNIVTVYDFGEAQGNFYLLMEFVDGLTLRQLLQQRKLSPAEALAIVPKICEALQYAHEQGIVHRDIKPENILLDKNGQLKIADFGIAKILGGDAERKNLTEEQIIGTPHYMSPEQIEKPQSVDHRADIYSLGVVFYEMLTGELPLGKFSPPSKKVQIDVRLDEIVLRALEKEPALRYQHVSVLKTEVEMVSGSAAAPAASVGASPTGKAFDEASNAAREARALPETKPDRFWRWFVVTVISLTATLFLIALLGMLAAIAIPNFVKARARAQENARHAAAQNNSTNNFYIGQAWFPQGDSIEITSVERTKNQMTVKGRYNLVSRDQASLQLHVTSAKSYSLPENPEQSASISKGTGNFELMDNHVVPGLSHVSMYADGHPFASLYFGNKQDAAEERQADWITNSPSTSITPARLSYQWYFSNTNSASAQPKDAAQILADQPPVVVETFPVSGARDVEPGETEIRVRFSKPMEEDSWSWSTAWKNSTPEFIGQPHYESDSKTCVAKVKLEPNKTYAFWLNSENFHNFKDADDRPAVPYLLIFQTKQN